MHVYDVLIRPVVTEKTSYGSELGRYVFEVDKRANKLLIKEAVETAFNVTVVDVNVMVMPSKVNHRGKREFVRKGTWKKAVVQLAPGQHIQLFEGV